MWQGPTPLAAGLCSQEAVAALSGITVRGRPDVSAVLAEVAAATRDDVIADGGSPDDVSMSDLVSVLVCGPTALIHEASAAAAQQGLDFHSETFHF